MNAFVDTSLLTAVYVAEQESSAAWRCVSEVGEAIPLILLAELELRNSLNLAIVRRRISAGERNAAWRRFETHVEEGVFTRAVIPAADLHARARDLSDRYTPKLATRSLDLLHVAAALLLGAKVFYSFDERQRQAAAGEGLNVRP